ncbi:hypothetical protein E3N88_12981 [Mikania micrantha]|uniref:Uncharacterized protein n=1 Tax=Mikania micrantha TaxID=192012 RepID=A0A5N6P8W2_9ASTR|nr:hypothetical protein E3N88_12981 [Mikania micrantha]
MSFWDVNFFFGDDKIEQDSVGRSYYGDSRPQELPDLNEEPNFQAYNANRIPDLNEDPCVESFYSYENKQEFGWESQPSYKHEANEVYSETQNSGHDYYDGGHHVMSSGSDAEGDLAEHPILQFPEGSTAFGRCAKFRTMRIGRQKAIDWDVLTEIGERERAERWIGEETLWRRLFELAFQPFYREVVVEFLSTFTFRPGGVPEVVFSMLRQRHEMSLAEFAVITGLYWEPETVTPLYTAGITEIDDATLRAWWPHIADDPFKRTKARFHSIPALNLHSKHRQMRPNQRRANQAPDEGTFVDADEQIKEGESTTLSFDFCFCECEM